MKRKSRNDAASMKSTTIESAAASWLLSQSRLSALIFVVAVAVYFNAIFNGFVYDDTSQVLDNVWIKDIRYVPDIFTKSVWSFQQENVISNYYRPLMHVIYMLNYHIFGLNAWGFHFVNVLFHAGVSVLVFVITLQLLRKSTVADHKTLVLPSFISGLLFATHPIHTEAVTWVAGTPDLSCTFLVLVSFYFYATSEAHLKTKYIISVLAFFIATLCKEVALTLPLILIIYDHLFANAEESLVNRLKRYLPYFVASGAYFVLRFNALGSFAPQKRHPELSFYEYAINIFPLFSQYLEKLILPLRLNAFHVLHPIHSIWEIKGILSLLVTTAFVFSIFVALKHNKLAAFSLLLIAIPLLPVLYIPGVGENTFAERYLYLPSIGLGILTALFFSYLQKKNFFQKGVALTLALIMTLFTVGTITRNTVWKNDYTLFSDTVKKSPDAALPHGNLGNALIIKGLVDEGIDELSTALRLMPTFIEGYIWLGNAYKSKNRLDEAITSYETARKLNPNNAMSYNNLGIVYKSLGQIDKAVDQYQIAARLSPQNPEVHNNLGNAYQSMGQLDKAIEEYRFALSLRPDYVEALNNSANTYYRQGSVVKAVEQFEKVIRLKPQFAEAHFNLGIIYLNEGFIDKAHKEIEATLILNPNDSEAQKILSSMNRKQ